MGDDRKIPTSAVIFCLTGLLESLQVFLPERQRKKKAFLCLSYPSLSEWLLFDREQFVFMFLLGLRAKNRQYSMVPSSGVLENI